MEKEKESVDLLIDSLFEEDDEFAEFAINKEWDHKEKGKETSTQREDDWDDDDVTDDFSLQLKNELENVAREIPAEDVSS